MGTWVKFNPWCLVWPGLQRPMIGSEVPFAALAKTGPETNRLRIKYWNWNQPLLESYDAEKEPEKCFARPLQLGQGGAPTTTAARLVWVNSWNPGEPTKVVWRADGGADFLFQQNDKGGVGLFLGELAEKMADELAREQGGRKQEKEVGGAKTAGEDPTLLLLRNHLKWKQGVAEEMARKKKAAAAAQ